MTDIDEKIQKRALFKQEFRNVIEIKNILSEVATKLIATAKNIYSPFTSVTPAKTHTGDCKVAIGTLTVGKDELVLDRNISNAITDCEEELSYSKFNLTDSIRGDLYATVMKKQNLLTVSDIVADATAVADIDLSTKDLVLAFILKVKTENSRVVGLKTKIDGAIVKRAARNGKPFIALGSAQFVNVTAKIAGMVAQSSLKGLDGGNIVETPYGVVIIDLGESADNVNRVIYGTGGVPVIGYREDKIKTNMGLMTSKGTNTGIDLELAAGDPILEETWFIYAKTKGRNGVFSNNSSLVSAGLGSTEPIV